MAGYGSRPQHAWEAIAPCPQKKAPRHRCLNCGLIRVSISSKNRHYVGKWRPCPTPADRETKRLELGRKLDKMINFYELKNAT